MKKPNPQWTVDLDDFLKVIDSDNLLEYCVNEFDDSDILEMIGAEKIVRNFSNIEILKQMDRDDVMQFVLNEIDIEEYGLKLTPYRE